MLPAAAAQARGTTPHGTDSLLSGICLRLAEIRTMLPQVEGVLPDRVAEALQALADLL